MRNSDLLDRLSRISLLGDMKAQLELMVIQKRNGTYFCTVPDPVVIDTLDKAKVWALSYASQYGITDTHLNTNQPIRQIFGLSFAIPINNGDGIRIGTAVWNSTTYCIYWLAQYSLGRNHLVPPDSLEGHCSETRLLYRRNLPRSLEGCNYFSAKEPKSKRKTTQRGCCISISL